MAAYFFVMITMLKEPAPRQHALEMVILEDLVPADHLLCKIDKYIEFEFIRDKVRHLYFDNNGRRYCYSKCCLSANCLACAVSVS